MAPKMDSKIASGSKLATKMAPEPKIVSKGLPSLTLERAPAAAWSEVFEWDLRSPNDALLLQQCRSIGVHPRARLR